MFKYKSGDKFNSWELIEYKQDGKWLAKCLECGNNYHVPISNMTKGKTTMCAKCSRNIKSKYNSISSKTHELNGIYVSYRAMKGRCYDKGCNGFDSYGGKGVKVCDEWKDNFEAFKEWSLDNGWEKGLVISRCGDTGNYEPNNCVWITKSQNSKDANLGRPNPNRTISAETVLAIRAEKYCFKKEGRNTTQTIAERYNVSRRMVEVIRQGRQYKDIK